MAVIQYLQNDYQTPESKFTISTSSGWLSNFLFYMIFFFITIKAGIQARLGIFNDQRWRKCSYNFFKLIEFFGGKFKISGLDEIKKVDGPAVFVCNHMSTLETLVLCYLISPSKLARFVIKKELLSIPFFGAGLKAQKSIVVSRKSPIQDVRQVLEQGSKALKEGYSVIIFPQTTRAYNFNHDQFSNIGCTLARRNELPVIPVALKTDFWRQGKWIKHFGVLDQTRTIHFEFGAPLKITGAGRQEHNKTISFIQDHLSQWQTSNNQPK